MGTTASPSPFRQEHMPTVAGQRVREPEHTGSRCSERLGHCDLRALFAFLAPEMLNGEEEKHSSLSL